jgi:integrase
MAKILTVAAVAKYRPGSKRREIPDGGAKGLHLVIQPSGVKSWALRYRRPNGKNAKLTLGPVDLSGAETDHAPKIGAPLSLVGARMLAAEQLRERARGVDVAAVHVASKRRERELVANNGANTFAALARIFVDEHARKHTRRWRETAFVLGFEYPRDPTGADGEPTLRKNGLASRWRERELRSISGDELHDVVVEAKQIGVPGRKPLHTGPNDNRARAVAVVLGVFFGWAKRNRHISVNAALDLNRPRPAKARSRVLNTKTDVRRADELRWFWSAAGELGQPFAALLKLLLLTGCRRDELNKLTFDEVSDDLATLRIPGERVKNHKAFNVYLPPLAVQLLAGVPRLAGCKYVFSINGRTPIANWSKLKARLDKAILKLARQERGDDFQLEAFRLHDLRRSMATGAAGIGIAPHVIEACLNHVSGHKAGVAGVYNLETYESERRIAWARWSEHVQSIINGAASPNVLPFAAREA